MKKKIPLIILIVVVILSIVYFSVHWSSRRLPVKNLTISGNIEAHESVVGFKVQGRLVDLPVEEGKYVTKGDLIAALDSNDYAQQVKTDEAILQTREAELALALAGSRSQEIKGAQQVLADAQADLELKKADFQRYQALFEKDEVSAQSRDAAATNLKRAQAAFERSSQSLSQIMEGTRKEQIAVSRANVQVAKQNLEMSRIRLGYAVLRAPASGVVTVRQAELGEVLAPGTPVVTIADIDRLWLRGYINETDLGRIRWGMAASVKTDTYPGKIYKGRVSFISSQAEFTPKSVETHKERVALVYRIKIDLENPAHELKPGMPADAQIDLTGR